MEYNFQLLARDKYNQLSDREKLQIKQQHTDRALQGKDVWNRWARTLKKDKVCKPIIDFSELDLSEKISFEGYRFPAFVDFKESKFRGCVSFEGAKFLHSAKFVRTVFCRGANFKKVRFNVKANFTGAIFNEVTTFFRAQFTYEANYSNACFSKVDFAKTVFRNNVNFASTAFNKADFIDSAFCGDANFRAARFTNHANFKRPTFKKSTNFCEAEFGFNAQFSSPKFVGNLRFDKAIFKRGAFFSGAKFEGRNDFNSTVFSGETYFRNSTFTGSVIFKKATFERNTSFRESTFIKYSSFERATFKDNASFISATFNNQIIFDQTTFERIPDFNFTTFAQPPHITSMAINVVHLEEENIVERFRQLKKMAIKSNDFENELLYFGLETHAKAFLPETPFRKKLFIKSYYLFSDFGKSISRPFVSLTIFLLIMIAINWGAISYKNNLSEDCRTDRKAYTFAVAHHTLSEAMVLIRLDNPKAQEIRQCLFSSQSLGLTSSLWRLFHLLPATLFLFLLGLAIRNRVKIR